MFDLGEQVDAAAQEDKGIEVPVKGINGEVHHDNDGNIAVIVVAGAHSNRYRNIERQQRKKKLRPKNMTFGAMHDDTMDRVVACTLEWRGIQDKGVDMPCTPANVKRLYTECPWIYEDVAEAMFEFDHFFNQGSLKPSNTSSTTRN